MNSSQSSGPAARYALSRSIAAGFGFAMLLAGCSGGWPGGRPQPVPAPDEARASIGRSLPYGIADRRGWLEDIYAAFTALGLAPTRDNVCAVAAIIDQESSFQVDPPIAGLRAIAWREIDDRAANAGIPKLILRGILDLPSTTGRTYAERIDQARTERQLSDIYEDLIDRVPLGRTLFDAHNPIRTRGPMQVHVAFAAQFAAARRYPYPVKRSIEDELFTRRGGVYFGIAHLLAYRAPYDRYLFRFADFNAGQYASRNAAFQAALRIASGAPLTADGALLPRAGDADSPGPTELAARELGSRLELATADIRRSLELARTEEFEGTLLYRRVFAAADHAAGYALARAAIPRIDLHGPKIKRKLTTDWYAQRVDRRFDECRRR